MGNRTCQSMVTFQLTTSQGGRPGYHEMNLDWLIFQLTTSQGGRQQISTIITNICIHYSLFFTNRSFFS